MTIPPALWVYIVNPVAGSGRGSRTSRDLVLAAGSVGLRGEIWTTGKADEATSLARRAVQMGAEVVVAVGGDGTVSEVAAGVAGTSTHLAVIPAGGGNDFATEIGMPRLRTGPVSLAMALRLISQAPTTRIDYLDVNGRICVQASGAGLDAHVTVARAASRLSNATLAYAVGAIRGILTYRPSTLSVSIDERVAFVGRAFAVTVANIASYGGGLQIAPTADPTDGRFDVAIIGDIGRLEALRLFPSVYRGEHVGHPKFQLLRGTTVEVVAVGGSQLVHVDGTCTGETPMHGAIRPGGLLVRTPAPGWVSRRRQLNT